MRIAFVLVLICAAFSGIPMLAQELDLYDINDFVDPRELGARAESRGRLLCPCDSFLVSRVVTGGATSYLDVFRPTNSDATFLHLATSYYRGAWQANWKHTQLNREDLGPGHSEVQRGSVPVPDNKNILQLARYFAVGRGASASIIRIEASWTRAEYRQQPRDANGPFGDFHSRFENEFGFEGDIPWRIGRFPIVTSLVYVGRSGIPGGAGIRRVTLLQRAPRVSLGSWSLDTAVAVGSVHADNRWHGALIQPSLHLISPTIPGANVRVHIKYAPAYGELGPPPAGERRHSKLENQFSIFIDRTLFAKLFRPAAQ